MRENKIKKLFFMKLGPFCTKSAKIWQQLCPAALLFIRPFLSYAAEKSASWQHCSQTVITAAKKA
jgi:hypothetical protein